LKRFLFGLLVTSLVVLIFGQPIQAQLSSPYDGPSIPYDSMPSYSTYRSELLNKGWQPIRADFPTPEFPELLCGNRVCSAEWIYRNSQTKIDVLVWPSIYDSRTRVTTYRVAPSVDFVD
jgi:hypothetical protein